MAWVQVFLFLNQIKTESPSESMINFLCFFLRHDVQGEVYCTGFCGDMELSVGRAFLRIVLFRIDQWSNFYFLNAIDPQPSPSST